MANEWTGRHYASGEVVKVLVKDSCINKLQLASHDTGKWICPGLFDVQVNGFGGIDFNDPAITVDDIRKLCQLLYSVGVTKFLPTVVTGPKDRMKKCIEMIAKAKYSDPMLDYSIVGIHVEGPFITEEDGPRGAHGKQWVRSVDWGEFLTWQKASNGIIKKVTLAPEKPGALSFIERLVEVNIIPAIGHTSATEEQIASAVKAGAKMSTHLGNGAHPVIKRHPNYIWAQLANDELWAGLIADSFHLPMSTLKAMIRVKGRKAILTSDAVHLAGMPPGRYNTKLNEDVTLEANGFLHLTNNPDILAGSATPLIGGIEHVVSKYIATFEEAIQMVTKHPAQLFGLYEKGIGNLIEQGPADFILIERKEGGNLEIVETVVNGQTVYQKAAIHE